MPRDSAFRLTITALSPVHIASGSQMTQGFDFVFDQEAHTAYVINQDVMLAFVTEQALQRELRQIRSDDQALRRHIAEYEKNPPTRRSEQELREQQFRDRYHAIRQREKDVTRHQDDPSWLPEYLLKGRPLDEFLTIKQLREPIAIEGQSLVRYTLRGDLADSHLINEQIKDVFGRAYIPGSSLKGAIRTALGWKLFAERKLRAEAPAGAGRLNPKTADDRYEAELFVVPGEGNAVNRDVWRGLRVSDSTPVAGELMLAPLRIQKKGRPGEPTFDVLNVEALPVESVVTAVVHLDEYLLDPTSQASKRSLDYAGKGAALRQFVAACRARGEALVEAELAYVRDRNNQPALQRFYDQLQQQVRGLPETSFVMQLGWGAGWHSKTFDDRLSEDSEVFAEIVNRYRLQPQRKDAFAPGDVFPATRKLVLQGEQPTLPLGWVRVDVEEVAR